ncbi:MAG: hypothetical protein GY798_23080 [Hyphomicrobiales bacterium]|nr:hypothetical protein [Hyphomicrobiales bacterium]
MPEANAPETRGTVNRLLMGWVGGRLRFRLRLRRARYSLGQLFRTGLVVGLPAAAIVVATVPVTGMSWYFDTENWASGIWDSWAAERTDIWRSAMVQAVDPTGSGDFVLTPPGIEAGEDFSFVVVGDPGEGDISQLVLSEQIIKAASHDDVRFVVISSDVVYPTGAMRDYESKFWLPFKGVSKPVYAIPGNHDWYDALEAFNATFLTPEAARAAILARLDADGVRRRSSEADADKLIATVSRLRAEYGVPTQWQAAPFFQIQTEAFALIAIDTGISRRVDPDQLAWIERALADARGKLAMVILGHPFYAGGKDTSWDHPDFKALLDLFRREGVAVVMAGDTHDLEYYRDVEDPAEPMHHFVNGGGGAYLSLGTALSAPDEPVTEVWAHYPSRQEVSDKVEALNPLWKKPFWWWTKTFDGYPFSSEWLSAAFDYNVSPFMQSFVEVRVEVSKRRLVLIPYGVSGRLPWSQFAASAGLVENPDGLAEWVIPLAEVASDPQDEQ